MKNNLSSFRPQAVTSLSGETQSERRNFLGYAAAIALAVGLGGPAQAQLTVQISGAGASQYPIAIADFASNDGTGRTLAEIIRADLTRTGLFRTIDATGANLSDASTISFAAWKTRGADALAVGGVQ